jgi:hypothetical protein
VTAAGADGLLCGQEVRKTGGPRWNGLSLERHLSGPLLFQKALHVKIPLQWQRLGRIFLALTRRPPASLSDRREDPAVRPGEQTEDGYLDGPPVCVSHRAITRQRAQRAGRRDGDWRRRSVLRTGSPQDRRSQVEWPIIRSGICPAQCLSKKGPPHRFSLNKLPRVT